MKIVLIIAALAVTLYGLLEAYVTLRALRSRRWPYCEGRLLKWDVHAETISSSDGPRHMLDVRDLRYAYTVRGRHHENTVLGFGFSGRDYDQAVERAVDEALCIAPACRVCYKAANPA